jgi:hypothetical protein
MRSRQQLRQELSSGALLRSASRRRSVRTNISFLQTSGPGGPQTATCGPTDQAKSRVLFDTPINLRPELTAREVKPANPSLTE